MHHQPVDSHTDSSAHCPEQIVAWIRSEATSSVEPYHAPTLYHACAAGSKLNVNQELQGYSYYSYVDNEMHGSLMSSEYSPEHSWLVNAGAVTAHHALIVN